MRRLQPVYVPTFALLLLAAGCQTARPDAADRSHIQVVHLEHTQAAQLAPTLQHLLERGDSDLRIAAVPEQNALALNGSPANVQAAMDLVAQLDVRNHRPARDSASVIYLKNVAAADLAATLREFLSDDQAEVTHHTPSNSLLVRAHGTQWKQLAALIDHLDQPPRDGADKSPR